MAREVSTESVALAIDAYVNGLYLREVAHQIGPRHIHQLGTLDRRGALFETALQVDFESQSKEAADDVAGAEEQRWSNQTVSVGYSALPNFVLK